MATVTINGHTYSDDSNPSTGLAGGGHRTRFIPLIQDVVAVTAGVSGSSTVYGPASATDNALARFDGTTGKYVQSSLATLSDLGQLSIESSGSERPQAVLKNTASATLGPFVLLMKSRGETTATASGDYLGDVQWQGFNGTVFTAGAFMRAKTTGAATANGTPARIEIGTSTGSAAENRVVIDDDGSVLVGSGTNDASGNVLQVTGDAGFTGYTRLGTGAPAIKHKKLTGTSPATEGGTVGIAHGLTASKILAVDASMQDSNWSEYRGPGDKYAPDCEYYVSWNSTNIAISLSATNSGYLLSRPVKILITYEE